MKVKVRKSQVRRIEELIEARQTKAKDVEAFVKAAVEGSILASSRVPAKAPAKGKAGKKAARKEPARSAAPKRARAAAGMPSSSLASPPVLP